MILSLNNDQTSQRDANFSVRATLLYDVVVIKYILAEFAEIITSITLINEAFNGQPILQRFATFCQCLSVRTAKLWQFMRFSRFGRLRHLGQGSDNTKKHEFVHYFTVLAISMGSNKG